MSSRETPIETYTTVEARNDWKTIRLADFLTKYHVSSKSAYEALGPRLRLPHSGYERNRKRLEEIGVDEIQKLVKKWGEVPVARLLLIDVNVIRFHINGKKRNSPVIKKWKQPGVGLI